MMERSCRYVGDVLCIISDLQGLKDSCPVDQLDLPFNIATLPINMHRHSGTLPGICQHHMNHEAEDL